MVSETRPNPSLKASTRPRHRHGGSCFFWFLAGGLSGALGIASAWMMDERGDAAGAAGNGVPPAAQEQPKPRFDYATILPELEVLVPDAQWNAREVLSMPDGLRVANGVGMGRELFASMRRNALSAEEGACSWL